MKRVSIVSFILVLWFGSALAYDICDPLAPVVPCTYNGVDKQGFLNSVWHRIFYSSSLCSEALFDANGNLYWLSCYGNYEAVAKFSLSGETWEENLPFNGYNYSVAVDAEYFWCGGTSGNSCPGESILSIVIDPPESGGVASYPEGDGIYCGIDEYEICQVSFNFYEEVILTAYPSDSSWEFSHWDDGLSCYQDNPLTVAMDGSKTLTAVFDLVLQFPLTGSLESRTINLGFGDYWSFGQCPIGTDKIHSGIDVNATADEVVKAAANGVIKLIFEDSSQYQWGWCIVIEHDDGLYTTTYWHLNDPRNAQIYEGATVAKGQSIGTVKNMLANTHFHFGVRMHAYTSDNIPNAGALPQNDCGTPVYPAFPEFFVDPYMLTYE